MSKLKSEKRITPMEQQYLEVKKQYPNIIVFYRMGDFYEMFGDDAVLASKELEIVLTSRSAGYAADMPMCGFPHHSAEKYIARLVAKGYKVAVCDQLEDPKKTKKLVKRGVTRVVTPGTVIEDGMLDAKNNNFLISIASDSKNIGLAFIDISTGEFAVTEFNIRNAKNIIDTEIARLLPSEILLSEDLDEELMVFINESSNLRCEKYALKLSYGDTNESILKQHFKTDSLRGFGIDEYNAGVVAAGIIMQYISETNPAFMQTITTIYNYSTANFMSLDSAARRNLELVKAMNADSKGVSLLSVIDKTKTAMGGRLLRNWIDRPLLDVSEINHRLDVVSIFFNNQLILEETKRILSGVMDIERIMSRIVSKVASPKDLRALSESIKQIPEFMRIFDKISDPCFESIKENMSDLCDISDIIDRAIIGMPPSTIRDGGVIADGYNELLDEYRSATRDGKKWILDIEAKEKETSGLKTLKVGYNSVFGYYIEVSRLNAESVPDYYIRKQTLANAERYITPELKTVEEKILGASEKSVALEQELFDQVREDIADQMMRIISVARTIAKVDVFVSFAEQAISMKYIRPDVLDNISEITIKNGRHAVVENCISDNFIPNDTFLNTDDSRLWVITGPNMAGKSTYMRQVALIVLLAQIGSFVPATSAKLGIVDRIFTRIGAHDELSSGQSTFMVEMNETANIINNATKDSLVILDEIGRGTSTYDGLSIAWAVAEELERIGCKTLFATHYHDLNELENQLEGVKNYRIAVREEADKVIWLRKIVKGGTDKSYGIEVARLAGLPGNVISRSRDILAQLEDKTESEKNSHKIKTKKDTLQLTLFDITPDPIIDEIKKVDIESISPIEALNYIYNWKKRLSDE